MIAAEENAGKAFDSSLAVLTPPGILVKVNITVAYDDVNPPISFHGKPWLAGLLHRF